MSRAHDTSAGRESPCSHLVVGHNVLREKLQNVVPLRERRLIPHRAKRATFCKLNIELVGTHSARV